MAESGRMSIESTDVLPPIRPVSGFRIRVAAEQDQPAVCALSAAAFSLDISDATAAERWRVRVAHAFTTDPEGTFLAELDGGVIGVAQAIRRERLWCLATLAVAGDVQSGGVGRALLGHALGYGADADVRFLLSSRDPRALRLYGLAGFALRPTFDAAGELDRAALPAGDARVRDAGEADIETLAAISREQRGAPHTLELRYALARGWRLLRLDDRGFAVADAGHSVWLLVARDEDAAAALLWAAIEAVGETGDSVIRWITGEQQWAIAVALRAGLRLGPSGALGVRGEAGALRCFLPNGAFA